MSNVVWSRKCRKCGGQFFLDEDEDGYEVVCIQCGYSERVAESDLTKLVEARNASRKKVGARS